MKGKQRKKEIEDFKRLVLAKIKGEVAEGKVGVWWLSFADGNLPKGRQFLGVVIVRAYGFAHAHAQVQLMGINPGGEVVGVAGDAPWLPQLPEKYMGRLLGKEELREVDEVLAGLKDQWQRATEAGGHE